jgi:hypothetical protein
MKMVLGQESMRRIVKIAIWLECARLPVWFGHRAEAEAVGPAPAGSTRNGLSLYFEVSLNQIRKEQSQERAIAYCAGLDVLKGFRGWWLVVHSRLARMARRKCLLNRELRP